MDFGDIFTVTIVLALVILIVGFIVSRGSHHRFEVPAGFVWLCTLASAYAYEAVIRELKSHEIKFVLNKRWKAGFNGGVSHIQPSLGGVVDVYVTVADLSRAQAAISHFQARHS